MEVVFSFVEVIYAYIIILILLVLDNKFKRIFTWVSLDIEW